MQVSQTCVTKSLRGILRQATTVKRKIGAQKAREVHIGLGPEGCENVSKPSWKEQLRGQRGPSFRWRCHTLEVNSGSSQHLLRHVQPPSRRLQALGSVLPTPQAELGVHESAQEKVELGRDELDELGELGELGELAEGLAPRAVVRKVPLAAGR